MVDHCTDEWKIRGDRLVGKGDIGEVYQGCSPSEIEAKAIRCGQVVKVQDLLKYEHRTDEALLRKLWKTRVQLHKKAARLGLAPEVLDAFICSNPEESSLARMFQPTPPSPSHFQKGDPYGIEVMRWAKGHSLSSAMDSLLESSHEKRKQAVCRDLRRAIEKLHEGGIWHADLKPSNVFIDPIEFIDFGNSWPMSKDQKIAELQKKTDLYIALSALECGNLPFSDPSQARDAFWHVVEQLRHKAKQKILLQKDLAEKAEKARK